MDTSFTSIIAGATLYALTIQNINGVQDIFVAGDIDAEAVLDTDGINVAANAFVFEDFGSLNRIIYTVVPEVVLDGTTAPKLLLGGLFGRSSTQVAASEPAANIIRLLADGVRDTTFDPGTGANDYVTAILPLTDGGMVVGGMFDQFDKQDHGHIVRLDKTGAIVSDAVFSSKLVFDSVVLSLATQINPAAAGPQGQILVAGAFGAVNGKSQSSLARVNADGSVDASFHPTFDNRVRVVTCQPDGKILAGGDFVTVDGTTAKHIVRLNYDGTVDSSFITQVTNQPPLIAADVAVNVITPLGDGRYYIGGNFAEINGVARRYLGRVLADGTVDAFDPGTVITNAVQQVAVDPFSNGVYVTETLSKEIDKKYPPTLIRLFGDPVPAPRVTITSPIAAATSTLRGEFVISRAGIDNRQDLRVYVTRGGTAKHKKRHVGQAGDYELSPDPERTISIDGEKGFVVTIPALVNSTTINVRESGAARVGRTVTLTLQPNQPGQAGAKDYTVSGTPAATVTLE